METLDDQQLLQRCQSGDEKAFKELVQCYYQKAMAIAYSFVHNRELAVDISQEAFIRVYRNIKTIDANRPFGAYLYKIVKNLCLNYIGRHRKRWVVFSDFFARNQRNGDRDFSYDEVHVLELEEQHKMVWKALNELNFQEREIILLKDFQDLSYQEISEILEIPIGTVMSRLYYARKKLAQKLEKIYEQ